MTKTSPNFGCVTRRGNPRDLIYSFFCFVFFICWGDFLCRFRCSWPGDVIVTHLRSSSKGARRGTMK